MKKIPPYQLTSYVYHNLKLTISHKIWLNPSLQIFFMFRSYVMTHLLNLKKKMCFSWLFFSLISHMLHIDRFYILTYIPYLDTFYFSLEGVPSNSFYASWRKVRTGTQDMTLEAGNEEAMEEHCLLL